MAARIILRASISAIREMDPSIVIEVLGPGFSRAGLVHSDRARCRSGNLQSQHGDGGATHAGGSVARKVSDVAPGLAAREGAFTQSGDEERRHARPGRDRAGTFSDNGRFARGRLPGPDHGPVSAPDAASICRWSNTSRRSDFDLYGEIARAKGIRTRCFRSARAQLLSRGRLSSGRPLRMETAPTTRRVAIIRRSRVIPAYHEEKHIGDVVRAHAPATRSRPRRR